MNTKQNFKLALNSLATSKMRSFLTMLGIIIGVSSVIILVSLMSGATKSFTDEMEGMGSNMIQVQIFEWQTSTKIEPQEMDKFVTENPDILQAVTPGVNGQVMMVVGKESENVSVTGVSDAYTSIAKIEMDQGMFIQYMHTKTKQPVCVIGSYYAKEYFGSAENAIGKTMKFNGIPYTVIGTMKETAKSEKGSSDQTIVIPYTSAMMLTNVGNVSQYIFAATTPETTDAAMIAIKSELASYFNGKVDDFMVVSQTQMLESFSKMTGQMTMLTAGIAGISLLVGGIGIMNIMLVSVTERTREIGIRKSLGARRREIMGQFVIEAATTSAIGGVIGIIFGILTSQGLGKLLTTGSYTSVTSVLVASGVSIGIGIIFGYFPAKKAAALNPIDALRHD